MSEKAGEVGREIIQKAEGFLDCGKVAAGRITCIEVEVIGSFRKLEKVTLDLGDETSMTIMIFTPVKP